MFILWNRQSLRKKLGFCFVCMTIFPLLITVAVVGYRGEKIMTRMIFDHNRILTEQTAEDIDQQPLENALKDINAIKEMMLMIALLAAVFASPIGIIAAKMTTKPLADIAKTIKSLTEGNMDVKSRVTTQDEIGQLAATFNDMVAELCARTTALQASEEKHRSLVEHICIGVYREIIDDQPRITYANPSGGKNLR